MIHTNLHSIAHIAPHILKASYCAKQEEITCVLWGYHRISFPDQYHYCFCNCLPCRLFTAVLAITSFGWALHEAFVFHNSTYASTSDMVTFNLLGSDNDKSAIIHQYHNYPSVNTPYYVIHSYLFCGEINAFKQGDVDNSLLQQVSTTVTWAEVSWSEMFAWHFFRWQV